MFRFAFAALALSSAALAMPTDLPWEPYACEDDKMLDIKFLSDGLAIGVRLDGDDASTLTLAPVDEEKQAGFKDGAYKGDGDTLLVLKDGALTLTGAALTGAPYENCRAAPLPKAG